MWLDVMMTTTTDNDWTRALPPSAHTHRYSPTARTEGIEECTSAIKSLTYTLFRIDDFHPANYRATDLTFVLRVVQ